MPVYEYACGGCQRTFSVIVMNPSQYEASCPVCDSKDVIKQVSSFSCGATGGDYAPGPGFSGGG